MTGSRSGAAAGQAGRELTAHIVQGFCALVAVAGVYPWAGIFGDIVGRAIGSPQPLTLCVAAWLMLLVPVWVIWFGAMAWIARDRSVIPALLMALPAVVISAIVAIGALSH